MAPAQVERLPVRSHAVEFEKLQATDVVAGDLPASGRDVPAHLAVDERHGAGGEAAGVNAGEPTIRHPGRGGQAAVREDEAEDSWRVAGGDIAAVVQGLQLAILKEGGAVA